MIVMSMLIVNILNTTKYKLCCVGNFLDEGVNLNIKVKKAEINFYVSL